MNIDNCERSEAIQTVMGASSAALKKIADAADPLYKTLDDGQKRRLMMLTRIERRFGGGGWHRHRSERDGDRFDRDHVGFAFAAAVSSAACTMP